MRVVVAIDSLKGSLSSMEAVKSGVLKAIPEVLKLWRCLWKR